MKTAENLVIVEKFDAITVFTLNRTEKRNAFNEALTEALDKAINDFEDDASQWVGILTGGPEMFSAGSDMKDGSGSTQRGGEYGLIRRTRLKPLIAAAEGLALGGGMEILFCCDLIIASETLRLGLPEVKRGLLPTSGGLFRALRSLPLHVAKEVILTGEELSPSRAREVGLISELVPEGQALDAALKIAAKIVSNSPTSTQESLKAMEAYLALNDVDAWGLTKTARKIVFASEDRKEGTAAFFERREPSWKGR
jgi:enoyl-CoA hydratase